MSASLLAFVTLIYLCIAGSLVYEGRSGLALCFVGYAVANVGIILDILKP